MKIAICQINPVVGDLEFNLSQILNYCEQAKARGADLAIFAELSLTGYPPKDLLLRADFLASCQASLVELAQKTPLPALVGAPTPNAPFRPYNSAVLCHQGRVTMVAHKQLLPTYNVFDEERYFSKPVERGCSSWEFMGKNFLISICEDAWNSLAIDEQPKYDFDPIAEGINRHGVTDVIINMSASPYTIDKIATRERLFSHIARTYQVPLLMCGQVGANDQMLFDGHSMIIDSDGKIIDHSKMCENDLLIYDTEAKPAPRPSPTKANQSHELLAVLTMGIKDYLNKCRAPGLILGLSGGIDSAVCLVLAVRALGKDRVRAVYLPSRFSSPESATLAQGLAANLGLNLPTLAIEPAVEVFRHQLKNAYSDATPQKLDLVDQNLQSRVRGLMIMALANASGYLMLTTANKSELAVGYTTIYGDMCGALCPLGDIYKTTVYDLARAINSNGAIIPPAIIEREPTAELKDNQKDSDTMPKYSILDEILKRFIDHEKSAAEIFSETKIDPAMIKRVIYMNNLSEFKRRQAPLCLMVSNKVFGDARRLPIAKHFSYRLAELP